MRDKAVASKDQDPTTEPTPAGDAPAGKDAGPSDASETIVSGSHAAGTSARPADADPADVAPTDTAPTDTAPAEHEAWEAEFAGLSSSNAADAGLPSEGLPSDTSASGTSASSASDDADDDAGTASSGGGTETADPAGQKATGSPEARAFRRTASGKTAAGTTEVPGGHPSVAQRSNLPMRAASTMPNLSRHDSAVSARSDSNPAATATAGARNAADAHGDINPDADTSPGADTSPDADTSPGTGVTRDQGAGTLNAGTHGAEGGTADSDAGDADRGPWYVSEAEVPETDTGSAPEQKAAAETIQDEEALRRSLERERAGAAKPILARVIQVMIAVFFPVMLLAAAIRAVATPMFLWIEYHRPGFPADGFGFSTEDRMTYGSYAVDYLLNFASPRYLGDLVTPDGDPLYLASEVSHMADVKMVLGIAFLSALGMALLSIAGGIYLARRCPGGIRRALFGGAVATLALIVGLLVAAVLAWEQFFTQVHSIFFAQGNWTFRLDDTLIRLFPSQFWMDSSGTVAALVLLASLIVLIFTWPTKRRRERSRLAREATRRRYLESLESV